MSLTKLFTVGPSLIHGFGIIATNFIAKGSRIGLAVTLLENRYNVTENLGAFVNHSFNGNSILIKNRDGYDLIAIADIQKGEEITSDYNLTPYFLEKPGKDFV